MSPADLYAAFRNDVVDKAKPYLWGDEEVWRYMDEAQTMFTRLGFGLGDATTDEVVRVGVVTGEEYADIHSSILTIRTARLVSSGRQLDIVNTGDETVSRDDYGVASNLGTVRSAGPVRAIVIGDEYNKVRWCGTPVVDDEVMLSVYRMPLCRITGERSKFEIRDEHHRALLAWMKHLAYSKQDAETFDRGASDRNEAVFRDYCVQAKGEWARYGHKPRPIGYGGI